MAAIDKFIFEMNADGNALPEMKKVEQQLGKVSNQVSKSNVAFKQYANTNRALTRTSGNLTRNLGMASLQFQDIAVQASMGTDALRIMTMQGPQLASVFGPKGMIIGALVAVGGALALVANKTRETTFDFKRFGADMKVAFAPFIEFVRPAIDLVKRGFELLKKGAMVAINGLVNGINYFATIISNIPAIIKESFDKMGARVDHFKLRFEVMTLIVKQKFFEMLKGIVARFASSMQFLSTELKKFGIDFPDDIGKGALDNFSKSLGDIDHRLKQIPLDMFIERMTFEAPNKSIKSMKEELNNLQKIDLFSYFKKVGKTGEDALDKIKTKTETISDMIGKKFGDAFMSLADGTKSAKDAFRLMARDIIGELFRIFVVKKITGFISGAISQSFPSFGNIETRGMGGPVSAGRPYMVGEAGPELIIPNRSGNVIPNNKLGGDTVVVNQSINVTTGVQQTVRAEILGLMPQIQEASKAAVLDAKRRGGSFAGAF